ncbi:MAG: hypothetical protein IJR47_00535 [Clostridia bacterium]|nr:hypothetical protein [Clostridia bacterium]
MKDKGTLPLSKTMQKLIIHKYSEMKAYGESRHKAKKEGTADWKIFSQKSMADHIERFCNFAIWCRDAYGDKTLDNYKNHVRKYIDYLIETGYKPSTISSYASSICKLYRVKKADFIGETPPVERKDFEQSRKPSKREERFSFGKYGCG